MLSTLGTSGAPTFVAKPPVDDTGGSVWTTRTSTSLFVRLLPDPMNPDRCGYRYDLGAVREHGESCCWRPVWNGGPRCVWHAREAEKPRDALEAVRPTPGERLDGAVLRGVSLSRTGWFRDCVLVGADFTGADIAGADFTGADLRQATLRDVRAPRATFRRANVEDAVFRSADLRDVEFVHTRVYRANFSNVLTNMGTDFGKRVVYETALERGGVVDVTAAVESALWTYRELQRLFEENANRELTRQYYIREMDLRRRDAWRKREYLSILRAEGARWTMRYGVSPWRVIWTSAIVIVGCSLLFPVTGGLVETGDGTTIRYAILDPADPVPTWALRVFLKSLYFSVVTFATLGYGDIQPIGAWARAIAGFEALAGSLLLAMLVFVLTWRYSRR